MESECGPLPLILMERECLEKVKIVILGAVEARVPLISLFSEGVAGDYFCPGDFVWAAMGVNCLRERHEWEVLQFVVGKV